MVQYRPELGETLSHSVRAVVVALVSWQPLRPWALEVGLMRRGEAGVHGHDLMRDMVQTSFVKCTSFFLWWGT